MKFRVYFLCLFLLSLAGPVTAFEREDPDAKRPQEAPGRSDFVQQRYTFEDYIADLKASARSDEIQPDNPVSELAFNQNREYKPLNPVVLFKW